MMIVRFFNCSKPCEKPVVTEWGTNDIGGTTFWEKRIYAKVL